MTRTKCGPTCDRQVAKHGGVWRCGRTAAVRSVRECVGFPGHRKVVYFCRHHQRWAFQKQAAPWEVVRVVKLHPAPASRFVISQPHDDQQRRKQNVHH